MGASSTLVEDQKWWLATVAWESVLFDLKLGNRTKFFRGSQPNHHFTKDKNIWSGSDLMAEATKLVDCGRRDAMSGGQWLYLVCGFVNNLQDVRKAVWSKFQWKLSESCMRDVQTICLGRYTYRQKIHLSLHAWQKWDQIWEAWQAERHAWRAEKPKGLLFIYLYNNIHSHECLWRYQFNSLWHFQQKKVFSFKLSKKLPEIRFIDVKVQKILWLDIGVFGWISSQSSWFPFSSHISNQFPERAGGTTIIHISNQSSGANIYEKGPHK